MFWYSHPLITEGAGRVKTDPINEQRIAQVLTRYQAWLQANKRDSELQWSTSKSQMDRSMIAFPLAGLALGLLASYTFVHPKSQYVGKCFTAFTTFLGFRMHHYYEQNYLISQRFGNFHAYPTEIKRMIDNNDSRYAFKWLKEDFMAISDTKAIQEVSPQED